MATAWTPRPIRLPDSHLPHTRESEWQCRTCTTAWPCATAAEYLTQNRCNCGANSYWEKNGPRNWHVGPRCYTAADAVLQQAADLRASREAHPHYPPSHYYPPKPHRPKWPQPAHRHTPAGPGDIRPGTWTWVKPGGLHPGWGDIHHLAMVVCPGLPKATVWLILDGTVHDVRAEHLILSGQPRKNPARWWQWTVAQHLEHAQPEPAENRTADQLELFPGLKPAWGLSSGSGDLLALMALGTRKRAGGNDCRPFSDEQWEACIVLTGDSFSSSTFAVELGKFQVETVQSVSGLQLEQDVVEVRQVSPTGELLVRKEPGESKSGEITITRGVDKSTAFTDWIKVTLVNGDREAVRQNITIALKDAKKQTVRRIHLSNAWASRWEGPQLGAFESGGATEQVTITYEDITIE